MAFLSLAAAAVAVAAAAAGRARDSRLGKCFLCAALSLLLAPLTGRGSSYIEKKKISKTTTTKKRD